MPRRLRLSTGGLAYHVLNRAVGRGILFEDDADYLALERVLERVHERLPVRIISDYLMPTHWHWVPHGRMEEYFYTAGRDRAGDALETSKICPVC
jgi:REP element-mobilizing transposase RayT